MKAPSPAAATPGPDAPDLVFNSYSRVDEKWLKLLQAHLVPLEREGTIQMWVDKGKIESGDRYNDEIAHAIDTCNAAILLVSPHFQNSSFIQEKELPRLLRRADAGEMKLFWLRVSDCHLAGKLAKTYHSANNSQQSLDGMSESEVNKILASLTRDLEKHAIAARTARQAAAREDEARKAREAAEEKKRAEREAALRAQEEQKARALAEKQQRAEREAEQRAQEERQAREAAEEKQRAKKEAANVPKPRPLTANSATPQTQNPPAAKGKSAPRNGLTLLGRLAALFALGLLTAQVTKWMSPKRPELPAVTDAELAEMAAKAVAAKGGAIESRQNPGKSYTNSLGMTFLPVPGTSVLFCEHETRVQDYAEFAKENPGIDMEWKDYEYNGHKQASDHPVVNVSHDDAQAFCAWLSKKEGRTYRLPSDQEWSVAVGIGDGEDPKQSPEEKDQKLKDVYPWGNTWPPPAGSGNFSGTESASPLKLEDYTDPFPFTAPVGSFTLNHHGIKDLSGNVWELCADKYSPSSSAFVLRGGSWLNGNRGFLLSSGRINFASTYRSISIGFRCVLGGEEAR